VKNLREGVFEKIPGSGIWWAHCRDHKGRIRSRKAGSKAVAQAVLKAWRLRERALKLTHSMREGTPGQI
jgi:hypothetical protein